MIIKSMSRKEPSFGQLIDYMSDVSKANERYFLYQNVYTKDNAELEKEFMHNAQHLPKRKNGVFLYHEILSFTKAQHLDDAEQKSIIRELAKEYAQQRAGENLVFGTLHDDHDSHLHYHFLISANAVGESKRSRMSKAQFDQFKKRFETRVLETYPQLEQAVVINKNESSKQSNREYELKRRTRQPSQKDAFRDKVNGIMEQSHDEQDFITQLKEQNVELYIRGKTIGFVDLNSGRKHRLKTLGLEREYEALHQLDEQKEQTSDNQTESAHTQKDNNSREQTKTQKPHNTSNNTRGRGRRR